jgi:hypothetical protein
MIHRYIFDILTEGVAAIQKDKTLLDELFCENFELVSEEADAIKEYFDKHGLHIGNGYPRDDTPYPAVQIILGEEGEVEHFLNDSGGMVIDETSLDYGSDIKVSLWRHVYRMLIATTHPDVTAYYYEIVKFIMLEGLNTLEDDGCFEFKLSGMELAPDPRYLPNHIFSRQLLFECNRPFQRIDKESKLFRAKQVSGLHVDSDGSPRDVGDISTNVTTYIPGEENG